MRTLLALVALVAVTLATEEVVGHPIVHGLLCHPCKDLVGRAEHKGEEELDKYLRHEVEDVCKHLGAFKHTCEHELDHLVEEMVPLIEEKLSAEEVCQKIHCC